MEEQSIIEVTNLGIRFDDYVVIKDASYTVNKGDIFLIMGGSGCGKSVMLKHLLGLYHPHKGSIKIAGLDLTGGDETTQKEILKKIGVMYQGGALFGTMTLAENIALPIREYTSLTEKEARDIAAVKLAQVNLEGFEDYYPSEISGGMKKRAAIARALALNPEILFLDEPSAGLDPLTSVELDELILRLNRYLKTTIVIISHELASIFKVADRGIFLDKETKSILEEGTPLEMKEKSEHPLIRDFFNRELRSR